MAQKTDLHWCDSTCNPVAGCDGCPLMPPRGVVYNRIADLLAGDDVTEKRRIVNEAARHYENEPPIRAERRTVERLQLDGHLDAATAAQAHAIIRDANRCYAATLSERFAGMAGWPARFDHPELFPGRMARTARYSSLLGEDREDKPWMNGQPRSIFVSDMADALSSNIPFDYLRTEIIDVVNSPAGRRHVWLWLTKRPARMAEFARWLAAQGIPWPQNLVPMASVIDQSMARNIEYLRQIPAPIRGISVEPLWEGVTLDLEGISWVIVGGESGHAAKPFDLAWARSLRDQAREAGASFFLKQLGYRPTDNGRPVALVDGHGGDWSEAGWPEDLRIREVPNFRPLATEE